MPKKKIIEIEAISLLKFIRSSKVHIDTIDTLMKQPESHQRGQAIAKEMNRFNLDLDSFIHFDCKVPLDKLNSVTNKSFKL